MKKMGRPTREIKLVTKQTFIPQDMRDKLNAMALARALTRTELLLNSLPDLLDNRENIEIRRTHPRSEDGWVLLHVPMTDLTSEKANEAVKSMDVSMSSFLYSIIVHLSRQENVEI